MRSIVAIFTAVFLLLPAASPARAENQTREFVMSCTYGVLAGSLVGAASLAFADVPGESFQRVARGASLGLYVGILLGLYVVYIVPGLDESPEEEPVALSFSPIFRNGYRAQVDGMQADWTILRF